VFIHLDLRNKFVDALQTFNLRVGLHLHLNLVQDRNFIVADDNSIELVLLDGSVPRMLLYLVDFKPFFGVCLKHLLHHILGGLRNVAGY